MTLPLRGRWIAKGETDEVFFIPQETVKNHFIGPIESVKDAGLVLRGDAGAVILNSYYDIPGLE